MIVAVSAEAPATGAQARLLAVLRAGLGLPAEPCPAERSAAAAELHRLLAVAADGR